MSPGPVELAISMLPGLFSSPVTFVYYETPVVEAISPPSGPMSGFTQLIVTGKNFLDLGTDLAQCSFNKTVHTIATVMSDTQIICDTPSILNKQGYLEIPEGALPLYKVQVSLDGGKDFSDTFAIFDYYF